MGRIPGAKDSSFASGGKVNLQGLDGAFWVPTANSQRWGTGEPSSHEGATGEIQRSESTSFCISSAIEWASQKRTSKHCRRPSETHGTVGNPGDWPPYLTAVVQADWITVCKFT